MDVCQHKSTTRPNSTNKDCEQIKYSTINKTHLFDYTRKDLKNRRLCYVTQNTNIQYTEKRE